jgi:hypothetical protein
MIIEDAIDLVLELANQSVLAEEDCDNEVALLKGRLAQLEAIATVEDFFTNVVFG